MPKTKNAPETNANPFANVPAFRAKNEGEATVEYARALNDHVKAHVGDDVKPGQIFKHYHNDAGYASQGGMYAAVNGASGNGNGTTRAPRTVKTKEALAEKIAGVETKISDLQIELQSMQNELLNWDELHAEDEKKNAEKKAKDLDRVKNTLSELSPEQRLQLLKDLGVINATMQQNDPQ